MVLAIALAMAVGSVSGKTVEFARLSETGLSALLPALEKLPVSFSLLMMGAHPDDENNALMAYVAKGLHGDAYYLVSNWGEGGQNEIGPELYTALGALRRQELLAARAIDGAEQLYLGSYDFGFSKSAEETFTKWNREALLENFVRIIRTYRPSVLVTNHDTVSGHGHHQAMGQLVLDAYAAAGDPNAFPEQMSSEGLQAYVVPKMYRSGSQGATVQVNMGEYDPALGKSYAEIGEVARGMHKCQGMRGRPTKGNVNRGLVLLESTVGIPKGESSIADRIGMYLGDIAAGLEGDRVALSRITAEAVGIEELGHAVVSDFSVRDFATVVPMVLEGLERVRALAAQVAVANIAEPSRATLLARLNNKVKDFDEAASMLLGVSADAVASDTEVVVGQEFDVTVSVWNRGTTKVILTGCEVDAPNGWTIQSVQLPKADPIAANTAASVKVRVKLEANAAPTDAFDGLPLTATVSYTTDGNRVPLTISAAAEVGVVPAIALQVNPGVGMIAASGLPAERTFTVRVRNNTKAAVSGNVALSLPAGWTVAAGSPEPTFSLTREGEETSVGITVAIPASAEPAKYGLSARAMWQGGESSIGYQTISYDHIDTVRLMRDAVAQFSVVDVEIPAGLRIGYVDSGFDQVWARLGELGLDVTLLSANDLLGDLSGYDTIVLGIRAYLSRAELASLNDRLLEYVKAGGNLIVTYNKTGEWKTQYAPYPITVSSGRVTVEEAPMTILAPENPIFNWPNKITGTDWDGWIQERGLYFPKSWDAAYTPLVACADPNESVQNGSTLIANYGKGTYIYTALVWYRQIEGLVPGGVRIFANMLSLPKAAK